MEVKQDLTNVNFTPKKSREIRGVVLHSMWGTYAGSIAWFKNPDARASAHYCISKDGEITQCVYDKDIAWHAGIFDEPLPQEWLYPNPNDSTIGIELEDDRDSNWIYPESQRESLRWLLDLLSKKWGFENDQSCVFLHKDLNPSRRSDPVGNFSWDWVYKGGDSLNWPQILSEKVPEEIKIEYNLRAYEEFNNNEDTIGSIIDKFKTFVTQFNTCKNARQMEKDLHEKQVEGLEDQINILTGKAAKATEFEINLQKCTNSNLDLERRRKDWQVRAEKAEASVKTMSETIDEDERQKKELHSEIERRDTKIINLLENLSWREVFQAISFKLKPKGVT